MGAPSIARREPPDREQCIALLGELPAMNEAARGAAVSALLRSPLPGIRERVVAIASAIVTDDEIVSYLRKGADDMLRNAGLEILKRRGRKGFSLAIQLLDDADDDVVLQAVLALDHYVAPSALGPLRKTLGHHESNVVQAAIVAVGRIGDERVVNDLLPFIEGDLWLQLAAVNALGDLRSPAGLNPLILLMRQHAIGPVACDAVARIGGPVAFNALAHLWMEDVREEPGRGMLLPLLAHVAEGLHTDPEAPAGLRQALIAVLTSENLEDRRAAAICLLSLGPGDGDLRSIGVLTRAEEGSRALPGCLRRRPDLIGHMVVLADLPRSWAFLIARENEAGMKNEELRYALRDVPAEHCIRVVAEILETRTDPELAVVVFELFRQLPPNLRGSLAAAVRQYKCSIETLLIECKDLGNDEFIVLTAMIGKPAAQVVKDVSLLGPDQRVVVVPELTSRADVLLALPWLRWLQDDPDQTCILLSAVIQRKREPKLFSVLSVALGTCAHPALIRAFGEIGDAENADLVVRMLEHESPLVRTMAADSLGWIGGQRARMALKQRAAKAPIREAEVVLRSLIRCATAEDMAFFREVASSPEPGIRSIVADALANDPSEENLRILVTLAADHDSAVARRASDSIRAVEALS